MIDNEEKNFKHEKTKVVVICQDKKCFPKTTTIPFSLKFASQVECLFFGDQENHMHFVPRTT